MKGAEIRSRTAGNCLVLLFLLVLGATVPAAAVTGEKALTLSALPLAGQAAISAAIGNDSATFHAVKTDSQLGGPLAYRLTNSAHGFEAELTEDGVQMRSGQARWGLRLSGYGYGEELSSVGTAGPVADRNRVEYRRGALTEWYVNGPQGLEQGFTLEPPPARTGGPLTIEVEFSGGFHGAGDEETNAIALTDQGGGRAILRYRGVHAYDADGRDLGAWLEARGSRVLLRVDDTNARYPVVVDPFVQKAKLTAADGAASDFFGVSVAISGDTVVVGAIWDDIGANSDQGSAYVFVKPGGGWADMTQTAKLTAPGDFPTRSRMGLSVGCSRVRLAGVDAGNWREVIEVECVNGHRGSERSRGNQSVEHADAMTETVGCKPARRGARVIGIDVLDGQDRQLLVLPRARAASPQGRSGGMGSSLFRNHKDCGQAGRAPGAMPSLAGSHRWERGLPARRWWRGAGAAVLN